MRNLYYETLSELSEHYYTILHVKRVVLTKSSGEKITMTWEQFAELAKTIDYEPNEKGATINKSLTIYLKDSTKMIRWYSTTCDRTNEYWLLKKCHPAEEIPNVNPIDLLEFRKIQDLNK